MGVMWGYGRVSTVGQTTENQRGEIEAAGYALDRWIADTGVSGTVPAAQRPRFAKLLDPDTGIRAGDALVVARLDRLGRDVGDVLATLDALASRGVRVVVLALGNTDLTSSAGRLIVSVLGAVARMERDLLVERTQAGLARARREGKTLGRPTVLTDAQRADIRAQHAAGTSKAELARRFGVSRPTIDAAIITGD